MKPKNIVIAVLVGGVVNVILSNVPYLNLVNCLLCAGFWVGAILAVWLYKRLSGTVTLQQGVMIGALTGLVAGVIGFGLSFAGLAGATALAQSFGRFIPQEGDMDLEALSGPVEIILNLVGIVVNVVLGVVGGLIGGAIFRPRAKAQQPGVPPEGVA